MRHAFLLLAALIALPAADEDTRQHATLPAPAQETLRQEMLDNLFALNEIVTLLAENKVKEAGEVAENKLGRGVMGRHMQLPFEARPGPNMPPEMHRLGMDGHFADSDFAKAAASGKRDAAMKKLPALMGSCVACHASYRIR